MARRSLVSEVSGLSEVAGEARFVAEQGTAAAVAELAEPVLTSLGFRLVLVRLMGASSGSPILEIMAERSDGSMTVEDCKVVSLALSPVLDVHDPMPGSGYRLQISSPGIDRPLVRPSDFDHWAGFEAKIEMRELIAGRRRFRGILEGREGDEVRIEVDLAQHGRQVLGLPIDKVAEARLVLTDALVRESLRRAKRGHRPGPHGDTRDAVTAAPAAGDQSGGSDASDAVAGTSSIEIERDNGRGAGEVEGNRRDANQVGEPGGAPADLRVARSAGDDIEARMPATAPAGRRRRNRGTGRRTRD